MSKPSKPKPKPAPKDKTIYIDGCAYHPGEPWPPRDWPGRRLHGVIGKL